jgi:hypothetical protein
MRLKRLVLFTVFLGSMFAYLHRDEAVVLATAAVVMVADDDCETSCGPTVACDQGCWVELFHTTCGEYDGGHTNDWCDGDTCDEICSPFTSGEFACWLDGDLVDCETYGDFADCGDGICAFFDGGENCNNCEEDCGTNCDDELPNCGDENCDPGETFRRCAECTDDSVECGDGKCGGDEEVTCPRDCTYSQDGCDEENPCPGGYDCDEFGFCVIESDPLWQVCQFNTGEGSEYKCPSCPIYYVLICGDEPNGANNACPVGEHCQPVSASERLNYDLPKCVTGLCKPIWVPLRPSSQ